MAACKRRPSASDGKRLHPLSSFSGRCLSFARRFIRRCFSNALSSSCAVFFSARPVEVRYMVYQQISPDPLQYLPPQSPDRCGYFFRGDCITRANRTTGFTFTHQPRFFASVSMASAAIKCVLRQSGKQSPQLRVSDRWRNRCWRSDRRSVRFRMAFGFLRNSSGCATAREISPSQTFFRSARCRSGWNHREQSPFQRLRIVDDFQFCFSRRRAQQGLAI